MRWSRIEFTEVLFEPTDRKCGEVAVDRSSSELPCVGGAD